MARIRQRNTAAEQVVRALLHRLGHQYRIDNRDLPGSPDIANRARRWTVFVHGCFWHAHPGCSKATVPKRNSEFWEAKFKANVARDAAALAALAEMGFVAIVIWECELRDDVVLRRKLAPLEQRKGTPSVARNLRR